eukprot:jgi/Psemu1/39776/gm1.39776_g
MIRSDNFRGVEYEFHQQTLIAAEGNNISVVFQVQGIRRDEATTASNGTQGRMEVRPKDDRFCAVNQCLPHRQSKRSVLDRSTNPRNSVGPCTRISERINDEHRRSNDERVPSSPGAWPLLYGNGKIHWQGIQRALLGSNSIVSENPLRRDTVQARQRRDQLS